MDLEKMQIFGSGCGEGSVNVILSTLTSKLDCMPLIIVATHMCLKKMALKLLSKLNFFAGLKGPIVKRTYEEEEDIVISDKVPLLWSPCGGSEIFRINTSIRARKGSKDADDTFITIDSVDGTEDNTIALMYYFQEQDC